MDVIEQRTTAAGLLPEAAQAGALVFGGLLAGPAGRPPAPPSAVRPTLDAARRTRPAPGLQD